MPIRPNPPNLNAASITLDTDPDSPSDVAVKLSPNIVCGTETKTSGALTVDMAVSYVSVTGTVAFTLADGSYEGQKKAVECSVAASTPLGTLTINDCFGSESTVHVFTAVGQRLDLVWTSTGWKMVAKRRAGTQVAVIGTTVLTGYDMATLYDCQVDATKSSTGTKALPSGTVPGERCYVGCSSATNTPVGDIDFVGVTLASAAVTGLEAIGATTDTVTLEWTGAAWLVVANSGITVAA